MDNFKPLGHRPRKRFGQNFLCDQHIIARIIKAIAATGDDNLVEIGPGQGALSAPLLSACPSLQVIEIDRDLIPVLLAQFAKYPDFHIYREDVLKFDFTPLFSSKPLRIVGNLPYNISTPLIFHLLRYTDNDAHCIEDMHFMLQKEVVQRLSAGPGDKHYGRLSVMVQYYCQVDYLFTVPPTAFSPQPKVDSAIVRLLPHRQCPHRAENSQHFRHLVNVAFQQRRKTLRNILKPFVDQTQMQQLPVDTQRRPETLSLAEFVKLSNVIVSIEAQS
ncbi:MAG: 16S rRNA (adenine(1518)-N(6)/adenine(1519)-N(6))-dimethyltransferase RsmA [Cellvibrionaceae bacterium]|nr:16S rRNA (adenine(1518)-N(6)/adenine(1519)-N(6))-dimethyltransferase RsmA [Cellvibrionaceae bacterium]